jgi:hypothetical protein
MVRDSFTLPKDDRIRTRAIPSPNIPFLLSLPFILALASMLLVKNARLLVVHPLQFL